MRSDTRYPYRAIKDRARRTLKHRTPEEWSILVAELPVEIQAETACTIWWDFFSQRTSAEAWPHLNRWLRRRYVPAPHERAITALMQCGYTRAMAEARTRHSRNCRHE